MDYQYADEEVEVDEDIIQLVCFVFSDEQYALPIDSVREVLKIPRITPVPQMPGFTLGVINIRGSIVPVFDLRKKFGLPEKAFDKQTKLLVAEVKGALLGFVVDAILNNIKIKRASIDPSPNVVMKIEQECIEGLGQMEDRMIIILNINKLDESINKDIKKMAGKE